MSPLSDICMSNTHSQAPSHTETTTLISRFLLKHKNPITSPDALSQGSPASRNSTFRNSVLSFSKTHSPNSSLSIEYDESNQSNCESHRVLVRKGSSPIERGHRFYNPLKTIHTTGLHKCLSKVIPPLKLKTDLSHIKNTSARYSFEDHQRQTPNKSLSPYQEPQVLKKTPKKLPKLVYVAKDSAREKESSSDSRYSSSSSLPYAPGIKPRHQALNGRLNRNNFAPKNSIEDPYDFRAIKNGGSSYNKGCLREFSIEPPDIMLRRENPKIQKSFRKH